MFAMKLIIVFLLFVSFIEAARILIVHPTISKSHIMPLQSLSVFLAEKGHEITFMSTYPMNKNIKNYREIQIPFDDEEKSFLDEIVKNPKEKGFVYMISKVFKLVYPLGDRTLNHVEMQKLKKESFDLLIVGYFMTDFMLGLGDHFKCPTILFSAGRMIGTIEESIGNPKDLIGFTDFLDRLKVFLFSGLQVAMTQYSKFLSKQLYE
jgi:glucuronosyltransferase